MPTPPPSPRPLWPVISGVLAELHKHKWLFILLGTFAVVVFFWRIRYLPSVTITDIGLVAFAIVAFSVLMVGVVVTTGLLPALVLVEWEAAGVITDRNTVRSPGPGWTAPTALSVALYSFGSTAALCILWNALRAETGSLYRIFVAVMLVAGVFSSLSVIGMRLSPAGGGARPSRSATAKIWWGARLFALSTGFHLFVYLLLSFVLFGTHSAAAGLNDLTVITIAAVVPFVHLFVLSVRKLPLRARLTIIWVLIFFLLSLAGTVFEALDRAARIFRLGLLPHQSLVVSAEACQMAKSSGVITSCRPLDGPGKQLYEIQDVLLLNRLGNHVVIAEPTWTVANPLRSVPLPSAEVLTWYDPPPVSAQAPAPQPLQPQVTDATEPAKPAPKPRRRPSAPSC